MEDGSNESPAGRAPEREALAREFYHSVNNNMQLISSLFQLQANCIDDPNLLEKFNEIGGRIGTMALIYQGLECGGPAGRTNFKQCLELLADTLIAARSNGVKLRRQFDLEPATLNIETAIPAGLIAHELICHSLKHAFAGRLEGHLRISLKRQDGEQIRLAIGDDGNGAAEESHSLGMRLVKVLTGQIRGQMEYRNKDGAEFVLIFKDANPAAA